MAKKKITKRVSSQVKKLPDASRVAAAAPVIELGERGATSKLIIVGMGASAGGLEAVSQFLRALAPDTGMAFILVQHLAPDHDSMMPHLMALNTRMRVLQVADGMALEANCVYVIPPNTQMRIAAGLLQLAPRPERAQFMPIDFFFNSLAEFAQSRAAGIVFSGTASDGSLGIREIKAAGGITFAQAPQTCKFEGMPRSAIATGAVDMVMGPAEIAVELGRIAHHPFLDGEELPYPTDESREDVLEPRLIRIFAMLRNATGVDFTHYKRPTIRRRLQRRMVLHKITNIDQYIKYMQHNPAEISSLYQDILIHVTRFFREPESFGLLNARVFPTLIERRQADMPIRIWVPGCSTGEEPYSIAIALSESLGEDAHRVPIQVFATDVSNTAVEHARAGFYPESIAADVPEDRLRRYFTKVDGGYRIIKAVRDRCIFARQDLTRDPPFSKLDLIVCRNVLIYLGSAIQRKLTQVFHYALKPTGFLMLGGAESIGPHSELFSIADKRHKLYQRKSSTVRADMEFRPGDKDMGRSGQEEAKVQAEPKRTNNAQTEASRLILARYSPAGVVVDSEMRIIQFRGQTGAFLEPAPGEATLSLFKMAREGLLSGLRGALAEAKRLDAPARKQGLRFNSDGLDRKVNVEVVPLNVPEGRHFLILFEEMSDSVGRDGSAKRKQAEKKGAKAGKGVNEKKAKGGAATTGELEHLRDELAASREYLQSIIQDLEAANEELQSANEEILSSNEELQSTNEELDTAKEELQSTNEELNTVNEELQGRNEELSHVNSDLVNLLGSVHIAIVMVAGDLRIRRFTPMAEKVLNLIPTDVGRPISDLKPNIECPNLEQLIHEAIDTVTIKEQEVKDRAGNWYSLRIRPYKNVENRIDGAVLALFSIGASREARDYAEAIISTVREPLLVVDDEFNVRSVNRAFLRMFRVAAGETEGHGLFTLGNGQWDIPRLRMLLDDILRRDAVFEDFEVGCDFPEIGRKVMLLNGRRVQRSQGLAPLILLAIEDVTGRDGHPQG